MSLINLVQDAIGSNPTLAGATDVVEKEILHHDILKVMHRRGLLSQLTFIGGTSLRLCHNSNRLSEDLDFSGGANFTPEQFHGLGEALQDHLIHKYGLQVTIREPAQSRGDTLTWSITIIKHPDRPDLPAQKMHIDICSIPSFTQEARPAINHYGIASDIEGLPIPVQTKEETLADKMLAFAFRARRINPRDVWDIAWIKQQGAEQRGDLLRKKLVARGKTAAEFEKLITRHAEKISNDPATREDFYQEMSRFVPLDVSENTLDRPEFWGYVGSVVQEESRKAVDLVYNRDPAPKFKM